MTRTFCLRFESDVTLNRQRLKKIESIFHWKHGENKMWPSLQNTRCGLYRHLEKRRWKIKWRKRQQRDSLRHTFLVRRVLRVRGIETQSTREKRERARYEQLRVSTSSLVRSDTTAATREWEKKKREITEIETRKIESAGARGRHAVFTTFKFVSHDQPTTEKSSFIHLLWLYHELTGLLISMTENDVVNWRTFHFNSMRKKKNILYGIHRENGSASSSNIRKSFV